MADRTIRVAVIDDEPLARQRVIDLLAQQPNVEVVATASNGDEAVDTIRNTTPDVVFLDVQMPGRNGLEVVKAISAEAMPATIFTTAYDRFAIDAFDLAAVDYLVKPFDDDRFAQALQRARRSIELEEAGRMTSQLLALIDSGATPQADSEAPRYLDRIPVETRGQVRVVPVSRIDYITASGPYVELHVADRTFAIRERMQALEESLDPAVFFRIHRSAIVRLGRIDTLLLRAGGDYAVRLKDGTELSLSRSRREELEARLGIAR